MIHLRWGVRFVFALSALSVVASAGAQSGGKTPESAKVVAVVDQLLAAWNRHDYEAFAAAFTEDGDFVNARGGRMHGRKAIGDMAAGLIKKGSNQQVARNETATKMVKADVALTLANLSVKGDQRGSKSNPALATFVLVKAGGIWRITALEIAPGASATARPPE